MQEHSLAVFILHNVSITFKFLSRVGILYFGYFFKYTGISHTCRKRHFIFPPDRNGVIESMIIIGPS